MRLLLAHDAANHPPAGAKKEKRKRDAEPLQVRVSPPRPLLPS
jgi:hypothetical protein